MRAILVLTYDEAVLDEHVRSLYGDGEKVPGEPAPGRKLLRDLVEEAKEGFAHQSPALFFHPEFAPHGLRTINVAFDDEDELAAKLPSTLAASPIASIPAGMAMIRAGLHEEHAWRERSEARLQMLKAAAALEKEGKLDDAQIILEIVTRQQREEGVIQ